MSSIVDLIRELRAFPDSFSFMTDEELARFAIDLTGVPDSSIINPLPERGGKGKHVSFAPNLSKKMKDLKDARAMDSLIERSGSSIYLDDKARKVIDNQNDGDLRIGYIHTDYGVEVFGAYEDEESSAQIQSDRELALALQASFDDGSSSSSALAKELPRPSPPPQRPNPPLTLTTYQRPNLPLSTSVAPKFPIGMPAERSSDRSGYRSGNGFAVPMINIYGNSGNIYIGSNVLNNTHTTHYNNQPKQPQPPKEPKYTQTQEHTQAQSQSQTQTQTVRPCTYKMTPEEFNYARMHNSLE